MSDEGHARNALSAHLTPPQADAVAAKLAQARQERVAERVREGDATLWGTPGTPEVADRLGWLTIARRMQGQLGELRSFADEARGEGITDVVLLGMGGSSLAAEVLRRSFGPQPGSPRLRVLDSTDAATVLAVEQAVELERTLFLVSSKSGGTIEPLSMFAHFHALVPDGRRFVAITDPGTGLERRAREEGFRRVFAGDPAIGGRYSALSAFGLVPAALAGFDVAALLAGAQEAWIGPANWAVPTASKGTPEAARAASKATPEADPEPAWLWLGAALAALAQTGRDKLTILPSRPLASLGLWLEQLLAESTGKEGTGVLPVAEEPLGEPSAYGPDRVFLHLPDTTAPDPQSEERVAALAAAGHPVIALPTHGAGDLGRVFMHAELAVAVAGWGLGINPFDQPDVQQAKDATGRVLEGFEARGELPQPPNADMQALARLLGGAEPPHYVALMGYVGPSPAFDAAVAELREAIRGAHGATTTFGYGPRFLHSTGQFHKGGPPVGRFLQLLHDGPQDAAIPGSPYGFTTLKNAQAIGDLQTLRARGLPAERVRLEGGDPAAALRALTGRTARLLG